MEIVFGLLLIHHVSSFAINNYDIEVEGTLRVGNDILDQLNRRRYMNKNIDRKTNNVISPKEKRYISRKAALEMTPQIRSYLDKVVSYGVHEIDYFAKYLRRELQVEDNVTSILNHKVIDYQEKVKNYITLTLKREAKRNNTTVIDKEYMYLGILSFANVVLFNEERRMLERVLQNGDYNETKPEVKEAHKLVYKTKKGHMQKIRDYICEKMNICRPFPGFSDYVTDLISVSLELSDSKFSRLVRFVKGKVIERANFFKSFMKQNVIDIIALKLTYLYQDLSSLRDVLKAVKANIISRYKVTEDYDDQERLRNTATSILLDIIDTAFSKQRDDLTEITFDTTMKALQQFQEGDREEIETPIKLFLEHIVSILREHCNLATRQEMMIVTEVITLGESNEDGFDELFRHGSEFVQNGVSPILL